MPLSSISCKVVSESAEAYSCRCRTHLAELLPLVVLFVLDGAQKQIDLGDDNLGQGT